MSEITSEYDPEKDPVFEITLEDVLCPIFDSKRGYRLKMARMKMLMNQEQLSVLLGCTQQVISALEKGRITYPPFTLARLKVVFGKHYLYILLGKYTASFSPVHIQNTYHRARFIEGRKNRKKHVLD